MPHWSPGPAIGAGGYLALLGRAWLESHFALTGSVILLLSVIFGGLLLCTDYVLLTISALIFGTSVKQVGRGLSREPKRWRLVVASVALRHRSVLRRRSRAERFGSTARC